MANREPVIVSGCEKVFKEALVSEMCDVRFHGYRRY